MVAEAEVVYWLKRNLVSAGLAGRPVREILVDADGSYTQSPFANRLKPFATVWIGERRPDMVCVAEDQDHERIVGFEVKGESSHEKGIVQARQYREGLHESYLCIPASPDKGLRWLRDHARDNGIGLILASPKCLKIAESPTRLLPNPVTLEETRQFLDGDLFLRSFGLNKPLHYIAATVAALREINPQEAMEKTWGLGKAVTGHAFRGAETLGLLKAGLPTRKGRAYVQIFEGLGFRLQISRGLTRRRLVDQNPDFAAVLRAPFLEHPAVRLTVNTLEILGGGPVTVLELAKKALLIESGMARALFWIPSLTAEPWEIRPNTRFTFKAILHDIDILSMGLASGANTRQGPDGYDPSTDLWTLGEA